MSEKLKVFNNVVDATSTSATLSIPIVTTTATSQAVIKSYSYKAQDALYPVTATLKHDNRVLDSRSASDAESIDDALEGTQIIDSSSSLTFEIETGADIKSLPFARAAAFRDGQGIDLLFDASTDVRTSNNGLTFDDVKEGLTNTQITTGSYDASSAFGMIINGTPHYCRSRNSLVYRYNEAGTLVQTSVAASASGTCYGACTDGTYYYLISGSLTTVLQRINVSDGQLASNITLSQNVAGQASNQGGWMLYYDGYVYSLKDGSSNANRINVSTGEVSTITLTSGGGYCAGGVVTVAADGTPYIISYTQGAYANAINLLTLGVTKITCADLGTSTEYGNLAMEILPGVAIFIYNGSYIWVDVNTLKAASSPSATSSIGFPSNFYSNGQASSIANLSFHDREGSQTFARNTTYSLYVDGVDIQGV